MSKPTFRRLVAYIIDMLIIGIISTAISSLGIFSKYEEAYNEASEKYLEIFETIGESPKKANEIMKDDTLYSMTYDVNKTGFYINVITLVVTALYFIGFQYITNGKTGGKALMKIEVVSDDKKKLSLVQIVKRSLIINNLIFNLIGLILIQTLSKSAYINVSQIVEILELGVMLFTFGMIIYREDGRGLHDLFGGTRVILSSEREYYYKKNKKHVKDAKIVKESEE